jgi:hypothetical protein
LAGFDGFDGRLGGRAGALMGAGGTVETARASSLAAPPAASVSVGASVYWPGGTGCPLIGLLIVGHSSAN